MYYNIKIKSNKGEYSLDSFDKDIIQREMDLYFASMYQASPEFRSKIKNIDISAKSYASYQELEQLKNVRENVVSSEIKTDIPSNPAPIITEQNSPIVSAGSMPLINEQVMSSTAPINNQPNNPLNNIAFEANQNLNNYNTANNFNGSEFAQNNQQNYQNNQFVNAQAGNFPNNIPQQNPPIDFNNIQQNPNQTQPIQQPNYPNQAAYDFGQNLNPNQQPNLNIGQNYAQGAVQQPNMNVQTDTINQNLNNQFDQQNFNQNIGQVPQGYNPSQGMNTQNNLPSFEQSSQFQNNPILNVQSAQMQAQQLNNMQQMQNAQVSAPDFSAQTTQQNPIQQNNFAAQNQMHQQAEQGLPPIQPMEQNLPPIQSAEINLPPIQPTENSVPTVQPADFSNIQNNNQFAQTSQQDAQQGLSHPDINEYNSIMPDIQLEGSNNEFYQAQNGFLADLSAQMPKIDDNQNLADIAAQIQQPADNNQFSQLNNAPLNPDLGIMSQIDNSTQNLNMGLSQTPILQTDIQEDSSSFSISGIMEVNEDNGKPLEDSQNTELKSSTNQLEAEKQANNNEGSLLNQAAAYSSSINPTPDTSVDLNPSKPDILDSILNEKEKEIKVVDYFEQKPQETKNDSIVPEINTISDNNSEAIKEEPKSQTDALDTIVGEISSRVEALDLNQNDIDGNLLSVLEDNEPPAIEFSQERLQNIKEVEDYNTGNTNFGSGYKSNFDYDNNEQNKPSLDNSIVETAEGIKFKSDIEQTDSVQPMPQSAPEEKVDLKTFISKCNPVELADKFLVCAYYIKNIIHEESFTLKSINAKLFTATGQIANVTVVEELLNNFRISAVQSETSKQYTISPTGEEYFKSKYKL